MKLFIFNFGPILAHSYASMRQTRVSLGRLLKGFITFLFVLCFIFFLSSMVKVLTGGAALLSSRDALEGPLLEVIVGIILVPV